nr:MAG TPA: hypothetical protein [Caudoviricetes sp.]
MVCGCGVPLNTRCQNHGLLKRAYGYVKFNI